MLSTMIFVSTIFVGEKIVETNIDLGINTVIVFQKMIAK
jgi:hypothetical protein